MQLSRIILYVKHLAEVADFYELHFGLRRLEGATDGWIELADSRGGCTIALHKASVAQKSGAAMKIVFGVADVQAFKSVCKQKGLEFGPIHTAEGFEFCNAKDPAGNSISISSRGF